ncbi:MAG: hypothetical protein AAB474_02315, partial [Patescibacteria group bacterium]
MARKIIGEILREGRRFFSLNFAASLCGYSKEYLRQLILKEKLKAEMINGNWFVPEDEMKNLRQAVGANGVNIIKNKNNEIAELKEEVKKLRDLFESKLSFSESKIKTTSVNKTDSWDRLLLNLPTEDSAKVKTSVKFKKDYLLTCLSIIIFLAGIFFYRHPESIYANFKDFRKFSNQVFNQTAQFFKQTNKQAVEISVLFAAKGTAAASVVLSDLKTF